ncbi:MAG TPA: imelysin family protein [Nannocystaceae bacterium]|nr:imelysin family protein [Nannocystaceae bacterium]
MPTRPTRLDRPAPRLAWCIPLLCAALGSWSWACRSDGLGEEGSGDDDDGDDDSAGGDDGPADDTANSGAVDRGDVLASIATRVVVPTTADFTAAADALEAATAAYAQAMADDPASAADELAAVEAAFHSAFAHWQLLEVMQVGPLGASTITIAGEDLRDAIYSWPTVNPCRVDQRLADAGYEADGFFTDNLVLAYGFAALEYLVFVHEAAHACPTQVQLDAAWNGLGLAEIERRRAAYAHVVAVGISRQADALASRWSPDGDDFASLLARPGGDSPYESEAQALDEVFRAMFYLDSTTKDAKLGRPLGLAEGCASTPCPELLESPHGGDAGPAIVANLQALRLLVTGGPDPATADGFDDLLAEAGHPEIGESLLADIDAAIAEIEAIEEPLQSVIVADPARVQSAYDAIKRVTDALKGPFVMTLMLTIPMEGAGDAD